MTRLGKLFFAGLLVLLAVPAMAQDAVPAKAEGFDMPEPTPALDSSECQPAAAISTQPDPDLLFLQPEVRFAAAGDDAGGSTRASCDARCWNGSSVWCHGSSCSATDSNCPGQRGYCWGSSTGYRSCPRCPSTGCSATASCANAGGGSVSCNGTNNDCYAIDNCYAYCNGQYHFCPSPPGPCPF